MRQGRVPRGGAAPETSLAGASDAELLNTEPEELMLLLAPYWRRLIRRYARSPEVRQDLVGEVYCLLITLLATYDASRGVPLRAYLVSRLRTGVFTYARSEWRRAAREQALSRIDENERPCPALIEEFDWPDRISLRACLLSAMEQLTERQRTVVHLRYFQEREFDAIAEVLDVKPSTARSLLRHGLRRLRRILGEEVRQRAETPRSGAGSLHP